MCKSRFALFQPYAQSLCSLVHLPSCFLSGSWHPQYTIRVSLFYLFLKCPKGLVQGEIPLSSEQGLRSSRLIFAAHMVAVWVSNCHCQSEGKATLRWPSESGFLHRSWTHKMTERCMLRIRRSGARPLRGGALTLTNMAARLQQVELWILQALKGKEDWLWVSGGQAEGKSMG